LPSCFQFRHPIGKPLSMQAKTGFWFRARVPVICFRPS
jgi:hypothetical protein